MNAFALHDVSDQATVRRWGASAFAIVAAHAALIALAINWATQRPLPGVSLPVIMVDMAPVSAAPQPTQMDLAPGPVMQQADASPPPAAAQQEVVQEQIAPTPPQEKPEVVAPPEQKTEPAPPKPEPAKVEPEKRPSPVKPKVVRAEAKKPTDAPPAPRTTASPKAERQAPAASAASAGASAAALASYRQMVAAHLQRFKQYPPAAKAAGQQGTARVSFTLSRSGGVTSVSLGGSSGHAALDAETLAMVRRAQPFPAFPADVKQSSMPFSAPVAFYIR
ncbi:energy transducer TonB [Bradyrhizobium sp. CB3481]|uniref:energy transducer TonB family protein n=1 Tax=Bradyrhizobium sp. CB3481 TaxID=3039158 RepID=UPI0024B0EABB|nr:energy transducer TonB [Bradyrhizobium sp. CB3481]WFU18034.1 energy transducer TonB [Bradyrhizobium sp. CB3481]